MEFKICTVGCGGIAQSVHGPAYRRFIGEYPEARLAACCDTDEGKAEEFRDKFGFARHYTDYAAMLEMEKPDAVCLSVPAHLTARLAADILERGCPLFMEKPPGLNREETFSIIRAAEKGGASNQVAFNRRYMPVAAELKRLLLKEHKPEDIQTIRYDLYRTDRRDADFAETAIHGIDAVRFIAGSDFANVAFDYQELPLLGAGVANLFLFGRLESGATARLSFCPVAGITMERASVSVHNGTYEANLPVWNSIDAPGSLLQYAGGSLVLDIRGDRLCGGERELSVTNGFYQENKSFFLDIMAGRRPEGDVASALQSVEIADCIRQRRREYRK